MYRFQDRIDAFVRGSTWSEEVRSKIMGYNHNRTSPYRAYTSNTTRGFSYPETEITRKRTKEEALQRLMEIEIPVPPFIRRYLPIGKYISAIQWLAKGFVELDPLNRLE